MEAGLVGRELVPGDVEVVDGKIARVGLSSANGKGVASPGFVDLQVNGFGGVDFLDADAAGYRVAGQAMLETGVTAYLPTFISAPEEQLVAALAEMPNGSEDPHVLGAHLEGPFLAPEKAGHASRVGAPRSRHRAARAAARGRVRCGSSRWRPSSPAPTRSSTCCTSAASRCPCGHTDANALEANAAFDLGVHTVTHLFNAMRPFNHRDPGIAGVALARDDVIVQVTRRPPTSLPTRPSSSGTSAAVASRSSPTRWPAPATATARTASVGSSGDQGRCGPRPGRSPRRQLVDDDRGGTQPPLASASRSRMRSTPPRPCRRGSSGALRRVSSPVRRADVVVLDDNLEVDRVLVGGELSGVA